MIGKIKEFNFKSLLIFNTFALIVTSFFFNNFIFIGVYTLFFFDFDKVRLMYKKKKLVENQFTWPICKDLLFILKLM